MRRVIKRWNPELCTFLLIFGLMLPQLGDHVKTVPTVIASNEVSRITHLTEMERLEKDARSVLFEANGDIVILRG